MSTNLSYQPVESIITPGGSLNYENTYDELGGLVKSAYTVLNEGEPVTYELEYEYMELE